MDFVIPWGSILYQLVAFLVLLYFLKRVALKPLMGIMEQRQQTINEQIESAEKNRQDAEEFLSRQREELENARLESQRIVQEAKKLGEQQGRAILDEAIQDAERMKNAAITEIKREREQAISELREQVSTLSVLIASKVIEKELSVEDQKKLIDEYIQEVGEVR
ncbi:ATP synthase F0 subunit B [Bacillus sp. HMF5848]|uniref:F0F1 ATP synthase subunit B n=1 Tax=Bacillus sp. HMF5848 TaxID=2495421 RepID=UPI000F769154|nr:F0F1 ATP synthase subunit B [Bacillus sp. HMF5848]RSK28944.1 ATP synthase F0 subunit B [Bacillus sp. HMF5848]